jgi:hypothetical protein
MLDELRARLEEAKARYAEPGREARVEEARRRARQRGELHQVARLVEVRAGDVVAAAESVDQPDELVRALAQGCAAGRPDRTVLVELEHLERLVAACST